MKQTAYYQTFYSVPCSYNSSTNNSLNLHRIYSPGMGRDISSLFIRLTGYFKPSHDKLVTRLI